jgi:hypothetical protein
MVSIFFTKKFAITEYLSRLTHGFLIKDKLFVRDDSSKTGALALRKNFLPEGDPLQKNLKKKEPFLNNWLCVYSKY